MAWAKTAKANAARFRNLIKARAARRRRNKQPQAIKTYAGKYGKITVRYGSKKKPISEKRLAQLQRNDSRIYGRFLNDKKAYNKAIYGTPTRSYVRKK